MTRDPNLSSADSPADPPSVKRSSLRLLRIACLVLIALLFVFSVPWYREADAPLVLWLGLPDWVAVALLCYVGVAVLNGIAWLATDVPDIMPSDEDHEREGAAR